MRVRALLVGVVLVALLAGSGCRDSMHGSNCDIYVANDSACDLRIYVDGWDAGLVSSGHSRTVYDVGPGRHVIEAVDRGGKVIERRTVDLARGEDYYWRLSSC